MAKYQNKGKTKAWRKYGRSPFNDRSMWTTGYVPQWVATLLERFSFRHLF